EHLRIPHDAQPGVGPMIKDWKSVSAFALMVGAMMHGSAAAAFDPPTDEEKLDQIQRQLKTLTLTLSNLADSTTKTSTALSDFKRELGTDLSSMREQIVNIGLNQNSATKGVNELRDEMAKLRTELDTLRTRVQTNANYQSLYGPNAGINTATAMGKVEIV